MGFLQDNWKMIAAALAVVVILIIIMASWSSEHLQDVFYLDQIAMKNSDPMRFKYIGRDRDVLGQSYRDYYLENRMYADQRAAEQVLDDEGPYHNRTDYLDMPSQYRPKPMLRVEDPKSDE